MSSFTWSFTTTGTVAANPERVVAWWVDPGRLDGYKDDLAADADCHEVSIEDTEIDGVRGRRIRWKDGRGWEHLHHVPRLDRDVTAYRKDDGFSLPTSDSTELVHSTGEKMLVKCNGRVEFLPLDAGGTEIRVSHFHTLSGGRRRRRRTFPESQERSTEAVFDQTIARCRSALEDPAGPSSA